MKDEKSGTRKVAELIKPCIHPEHDPPTHMVYESGVYKHICPECGNEQRFRVNNPTL